MKFYHFRQNNSGGSFNRDEQVDENVIIEANSADEANDVAEHIGIYFNGCADGRDCPCCGDRWSPVSEYDATDVPSIYNNPVPQDDKGNYLTEGFHVVIHRHNSLN